MDPRTQERVERWESRPYSGGDDLASLGDGEFSGAVSAGGAWLFMLNGRVVGVVDGSLETIRAAASGTVYDAPDPALPLLCSMTARGGDTRAKYYTNETPISEVDEKLQSASFTGYIELSEQVLSGDYYVVYYGGRRMPAAYIGSAERLLTGDEAFERADDEVGIYRVVDVDVDVTDVGDDRAADPGGSVPGETDDEVELPSDRSGVAPDTTASEPDESAAERVTDTATDRRTEPQEPGTDAASGASSPDAGTASGTDADAARHESGEVAAGSLDETSGPARPDANDRSASADDRSASADDRSASADDRSTADADDRSAGAGDVSPAESGDRSAPAAGVGAAGDTDDAVDGTNEAPDVTDEAPGVTDEAPDVTDEAPGVTDEAGPDDVAGGPDDGITTTGEPAADRSTAGITDSSTGRDRDGRAGDDAGGATERGRTAADSAARPTGESTAAEETASARTNDGVDEDRTPSDSTGGGSEPDAADADDDSSERFEEEARWRETRRIPSIDPDATAAAEAGPGAGAGAGTRAPDSRDESSDTSTPPGRAAPREGAAAAEPSPEASGRSEPDDPDVSADPEAIARSAETGGSSDEDALRSDMLEREDKIDQLTQQVAELEARRDELRAEYDDVVDERDRLRSENQELSATVERLEARIQDLEAELEEARSGGVDAPAGGSPGEAAGTGGGVQLSPQEALDGTNVFVRYESKSEPTLESAHGGDADREAVAANLRLERHTQFDATDAVVAGQPYDEFLEESMQYRFVEWLVTTFPFEVRDTGRASGLADVYDVIPHIDRAELSASIPLEDEDEAVPDQVRFDVVAFDKMGAPLLVATLNDSREPATQSMLETLEESASSVKASYPDLGGAFAVTSSFFEPGALEIAEEATDGGFLNRGSKLSYVNLSRKEGYHLGLVESRSGGFHVTVPEL